MRCCSKFKQKVTDLKFSSCSASNCCCSWLCFLPEGVLGSSNVSNWLARSVSTSFSANKLFRSSWRTATCQGTIRFRPAFAKWYNFLLRIKYTTKSIVNSAEGMCDVWPLFGQLFHAKEQSHIWASKETLLPLQKTLFLSQLLKQTVQLIHAGRSEQTKCTLSKHVNTWLVRFTSHPSFPSCVPDTREIVHGWSLLKCPAYNKNV